MIGDQKDTIKLPKLHVYQISQRLPARGNKLQELQEATQVDNELTLLKHTIMSEMAQYNQRNTTSPATVLDVSQRTYNRRCTHLEGDKNCHSQEEMRRNPQPNS